MVQFQRYPAISGHRKLSVFSPEAQSLLKALGTGLYEKPSLLNQLETFRITLKELSPYSYRSAASDIRDIASLYYYRGGLRSLPWWNIFARVRRKRVAATRRWNFERKLESEKDLPFLLLFDGNGYNRELALSKIQGPLVSPIEVIALADLANNWVTPIRKVALQTVERSFPETSPSVLAESFSFLAENQASWKRWDTQASQQVMSFFFKQEVIDLLAKRLAEGLEVRGSRALSYALQADNFDRHLDRIFDTSKDAALRARALRALLNGEAVWKIGYTWKWVDKSLGERVRVPKLGRRKLSIEVPNKMLIITALSDKSALVRKIAAQALIDHGQDLNLPIVEIAKELVLDTSPGVRRRAEYLSRKIQSDGVS